VKQCSYWPLTRFPRSFGAKTPTGVKDGGTVNDKKEAAWFAVVAGIALLVLVILYQSGEIIAARAMKEGVSIPGVFWISVVACLSLCGLVPYLLKDSQPMEFRIIAILLTAMAPVILIGYLLFSLWRSNEFDVPLI